jgi:histidinol phosphatase-like PHP family hydrolase
MKRRTLLSTMLLAPALRAQQAAEKDQYYFDLVRDIYPVATGVKRMSRTDLQFPRLGEFEVVTGDFHVHTLYSEGTVMPSVRLYEAWSEGLDVLAITDHAEFLRTALPEKRGRAYEEVRELAKALGLVLIRGAEVSTVFGAERERMSQVTARKNADFIVLFVKDENALFAPFEVAMERAREQGCINLWAHPGRDWHPVPQKFLDRGWLHGIELRNTGAASGTAVDEVRGRRFYPHVAEWAREKRLALIASSDVHSPAQFEREPGQPRDYTLLLVKERSPEGVRDAILARRTMAWFEGLLWGASEHLALLVRQSLTVESMKIADKLQGLRIRNRCSFPFEAQFPQGQGGWRVTGRSSVLPPVGSAIFPATVAAPESPEEITLKLTNVFVDRNTNLELKLPLRPGG